MGVGTVHCSLVDTPVGTQLKTITDPSQSLSVINSLTSRDRGGGISTDILTDDRFNLVKV